MVELDLRFAEGAVAESEWRQLQPFVSDIHRRLHAGDVPGADFLGWLHLPSETLTGGIDPLLTAAAAIQEQADALVVVGIGGSYLGARAALEWCLPEYFNQLPRAVRGGPEVYFAGNHLSAPALADLLRVLAGKRVCINVISKSGTTTEPAVAFRVLRAWLEQQVGPEEARRRIYVTTDRARGALRRFAEAEGLKTFVIPDDVGGRYSVLTPVGLLPLAAAGVPIAELLEGARAAEEALATDRLDDNPAYRYAAVRNALHRKGKAVEVLTFYEPALRSFAEWWKQLFGESEGKDHKGLFPASVAYTTDLHSLGQFIQEGARNLFETVITLDHPGDPLSLPAVAGVEDGLEYLAGRDLSWINDQARIATQLAHADGGVPNLRIRVADRSARSLGELFYFFELACAASGLLLGVNPFDQPGVEAYKTNMFALLGKPGYESAQAALRARLAEGAR
ncbi:MAG: glucose-6-phosphate isomerase [Alicyclobacillus macrosporangiidus]|uniref:glucose-6-phosphate isomerase n=1 Tax=Alicyclobacillus macrosporangiidus TaxID=392015 RepID=UPI0026EBD051|nr:glucose-6-phosphate isomerase [Alicyclobacillus macrosporangiidus]MCL6600505.1 glucose-6-phosphate isomerase [Alicyclobacillus macrosporangiidus]